MSTHSLVLPRKVFQVAYDLLFRKQVPGNWSIKLVDYEFAPDPTVATPEEQAFVAKLAVVKMAAETGNKKKLKEKMEMKKHCPKCKKHTLHKEMK